jgi:peptide deformylase
MPIRPIELLGSPVLRREADEITTFDDALQRLVRDMFETMYHAEGVGLAGPQVGISSRILVIDARDEEDPARGRLALVNPRIVEASRATERGTEGCLSIPGVDELVERALVVVVEAQTPTGEPVRLEAEGFMARVLQHEIDHLDGILFIDRLTPLKRELLVKRYRKLQAEEAEAS